VQPATQSFLTVDSNSTVMEVRIKGSRFLGKVFHMESTADFDSLYRQVKKDYANATHYCYAYRISDTVYHYYDDGEPFGTAGRPIYHVLEEQNLYQVLLLVIRYFGGTKLGRNGLGRAYTQSALETLRQCKIIKKIFYKVYRLVLPYSLLQDILHMIRAYEGILLKADYLDRIEIRTQIPETGAAAFQTELMIFAQKNPVGFEVTGNAWS
jgi:uncharacterized YigZ family protein